VTRARLALLAAVVLAALFVFLTRTEGGARSSSGATAPSLAQMVAKVGNGVVKVETGCTGYEKSGTGFLVTPWMVATVLHVVNGADRVSLSQDGIEIATGAVVGRDYAHDLALVQTDRPLSGHVFALAGASAPPGLPVGSLGFAGGRDRPHEMQGSVLGTGPTEVVRGLERPGLVAVVLPVDHGDSGGPVFDLRTGDVVGLVDLAAEQPNGLGLVVDAAVARPLFEQWELSPQPVAGSSC
jgi:S1-C subfamily serine protease